MSAGAEMNKNTISVVFEADGVTPIENENRILVQRNSDKELVFIEKNILQHIFPQYCQIDDNVEKNNDITFYEEPTHLPIEEQPSTSKDKYWTHNSTVMLIHLRKQFDKQFQSTTIKNDAVWAKIANEMKTNGVAVSATQCKDKWQYLKKRYVKKCDNMGPRSTGEDRMKFEYFEDMDEFLNKKHYVKPIALSASVTGITNDSCTETDDEVLEEIPKKKQKRESSLKKKNDVITEFITEFQNQVANREEQRERRHRESLECRDRATRVFAEKMDDLIDVLRANNR